MPSMIDLRSDTVTQPTMAMRAVMVQAAVGDDVYAEDPTTNALEERVASEFGKEAGVFMPSGTMANQIAIRIQTRPGDELLTERTNHIILWEAGGPAVHSGVSCQTLEGEFGILQPEQFEGTIRPDDMHSVRTRLVCLENTHNRGGGTIYPLTTLRAITTWAHRNGLACHLDGARLWNAMAATGISGKDWATGFDTVSLCFSKGLGAPVGSILLGSRDLMREARRMRKLFGGSMRQIGILAAACNYALDHHVQRLTEDHAHAQIIAEAIRDVPGFRLTPPRVETNLVWWQVDPERGTAAAVAARLREQGLLIAALGERVLRACTHLNVSRADCERAAELIRQHCRAA